MPIRAELVNVYFYDIFLSLEILSSSSLTLSFQSQVARHRLGKNYGMLTSENIDGMNSKTENDVDIQHND